MEERKWENLNSDCLVNVFGRLDLETRLLDIVLVCKKWKEVLLNPLCWQIIDFPDDISQSRLAVASDARGSPNISGLINFVVGRSQGCCSKLVLPNGTTIADLIYVSDACPNIKTLVLPYDDVELAYHGEAIVKLIAKWKSLEVLDCGFCCCIDQIVDKIGLHCKNFVSLSFQITQIDPVISSAIVSKLANIKSLVLKKAFIGKEEIMILLLGCKELELLYIQNCFFLGLKEFDEEMLHLASRIKDFQLEGSTFMNFTFPQFDEEEMLFRLEEEEMLFRLEEEE
ncbi:hypothetical protein POM88_003806 [Heracleum sosnowskyi]|uniref:F-box domain-containing protein n=1 Tax=Heracleum sosnowskyi TaxID=360622 RepID=A0AAD8JKB5_9APIA|nr:hypothetical protein POM88_003806 [Heracleum sosnowskyi]